MFSRLGSGCYERRWLVLLLWLVALIGGNVVAAAIGDAYRQDFDLPGAESSRGLDILDDRFGGAGTGIVGTIVFQADQGVDDPAVRDAMQQLFTEVEALDLVTRVESPYAPGGERLVSAQGPEAGKIAYANVELPDQAETTDMADIRDAIRDELPALSGLRIELGGFVFADFEEPSSELFGLAFAIVILILAFGSVLAMGLPVAVALFGIGIGSAMVVLISHLREVPDFAPFIGVMIGLGVGIDYALLIVTRYREQLHAGHSIRESIEIAIDTAGRSVVVAGATVVISLLGMLLMGVGFVQGLAVTAASTVAATVVASVTLLPALLGFADWRIELTRWRGLIAAALVAVALVGVGLSVAPFVIGLPAAAIVLIAGFFVPALKREVVRRPPRPRRETIPYRWSRLVQRRAWPVAIGAALLLVVLSIPVFGLRLAFSDESNFPEESSTKQAYDLLVAGFGEGFNGPLLLVAELPSGVGLADLAGVADAVLADPVVAFVSDPVPNSPDAPTAVLWNVAPTEGPQEVATTELVNRLRSDVLPQFDENLGVDIVVTGMVAATVDFSQVLSSRLPLFFAAVLALSFLLLMVVFRSILVPLKAVIMNLLSIGAAYGVTVALFQWGWMSDIVGVQPAPIEPWAPMMLFAIVFGLSMDYEVFLLSRVREEWHRTGDPHLSVADGLASTARVITAAAAIMVVVFGAFILESDRTFKLMGTGLATAIFLDATVVRMLLVPATMELLGNRNWWLPGWLDRILPHLDVEGNADRAASTADETAVDPEPEPEPVA